MVKSIFLALAFVSSLAFAEPSFQQIESLIEKQQYSAAEQGLETIIQNHPNSAKAFYAMAQAQAGLGNNVKAKLALDKAMGIDPDLKFASSSNIESLQQAITPQVKKIEVVEESHTLRNTFIVLALIALAYFLYTVYARKRDEDEGSAGLGGTGTTPPSTPPSTPRSTYSSAMNAPIKPAPSASAPSYAPSATQSVQSAPVASHTTVINNTSSNDGLVTGMVLGSMLNNHHDTVYVERDVYVPSPAPAVAPRSSWDDIGSSPSPSRSSSWDDSSSSSKSSSWDDDSSSKSSSSWSSSSSSDSSWSSSSDSSSSWSDSSSSSSSDW